MNTLSVLLKRTQNNRGKKLKCPESLHLDGNTLLKCVIIIRTSVRV